MVAPLIVAGIISGIASLVGTGVSAVSAYNSRKAGEREAEKARKIIENEKEEARKDYIREANTDILSRTDTANILNKANKTLEKQANSDKVRATITGATAEAQAQQTANRGNQYTNAITNIAKIGQQYKDNALARYQSQRYGLSANLSGQANAMAQQHAIATSNSINSGINSLNSLGNTAINTYSNYKDRKTTSPYAGNPNSAPTVTIGQGTIGSTQRMINDGISAAKKSIKQ